MLKNFRTYHLVIEFYRLLQSLQIPRHLKEQLDRASSSVALNLAEGAGRSRGKDQKRFFVLAMGSFRECEAIMALGSSSTEALKASDTLGAHLYRLINSRR